MDRLVIAIALTLPVVGLGLTLAAGALVWAVPRIAAAIEDVEPDIPAPAVQSPR